MGEEDADEDPSWEDEDILAHEDVYVIGATEDVISLFVSPEPWLVSIVAAVGASTAATFAAEAYTFAAEVYTLAAGVYTFAAGAYTLAAADRLAND